MTTIAPTNAPSANGPDSSGAALAQPSNGPLTSSGRGAENAKLAEALGYDPPNGKQKYKEERLGTLPSTRGQACVVFVEKRDPRIEIEVKKSDIISNKQSLSRLIADRNKTQNAEKVWQLGQTATQSTVDGIAKIKEGLSDLVNTTLPALVQQDVEMGGRGAVPVPSTAPAPQIASGAAAVGVPLADAQQPDAVADAVADGSEESDDESTGRPCLGCHQPVPPASGVCCSVEGCQQVIHFGCSKARITQDMIDDESIRYCCPDHADHAQIGYIKLEASRSVVSLQRAAQTSRNIQAATTPAARAARLASRSRAAAKSPIKKVRRPKGIVKSTRDENVDRLERYFRMKLSKPAVVSELRKMGVKKIMKYGTGGKTAGFRQLAEIVSRYSNPAVVAAHLCR